MRAGQCDIGRGTAAAATTATTTAA